MGVPSHTKSFVQTVIDNYPTVSVHWIIINIPKDFISLEEKSFDEMKISGGASELVNSFGKKGYEGICPLAGAGQHDFTAQ